MWGGVPIRLPAHWVIVCASRAHAGVERVGEGQRDALCRVRRVRAYNSGAEWAIIGTMREERRRMQIGERGG